MDPITAMIVGAIALGAATGLKPTAEQVVKDAYAGLKQVIVDRYNNHKEVIKAVEAVAEKPEDLQRHETLGNALASTGAAKDPVVVEAANAVHLAGAAVSSKKKVLGNRLQLKLKQVEALERQLDLALDEGQKVIIQAKVDPLWVEIEKLEEELSKLI